MYQVEHIIMPPNSLYAGLSAYTIDFSKEKSWRVGVVGKKTTYRPTLDPLDFAIVDNPEDPKCAYKSFHHYVTNFLPPGYDGPVFLHAATRDTIRNRHPSMRKYLAAYDMDDEGNFIQDNAAWSESSHNYLMKKLSDRCGGIKTDSGKAVSGYTTRKNCISKMQQNRVAPAQILQSGRHQDLKTSCEYACVNQVTRDQKIESLHHQPGPKPPPTMAALPAPAPAPAPALAAVSVFLLSVAVVDLLPSHSFSNIFFLQAPEYLQLMFQAQQQSLQQSIQAQQQQFQMQMQMQQQRFEEERRRAEEEQRRRVEEEQRRRAEEEKRRREDTQQMFTLLSNILGKPNHQQQGLPSLTARQAPSQFLQIAAASTVPQVAAVPAQGASSAASFPPALAALLPALQQAFQVASARAPAPVSVQPPSNYAAPPVSSIDRTPGPPRRSPVPSFSPLPQPSFHTPAADARALAAPPPSTGGTQAAANVLIGLNLGLFGGIVSSANRPHAQAQQQSTTTITELPSTQDDVLLDEFYRNYQTQKIKSPQEEEQSSQEEEQEESPQDDKNDQDLWGGDWDVHFADWKTPPPDKR
jgi:hypothetical protein